MLKYVCIALLISYVAADKIGGWTSCGKATIHEITIQGCSGNGVCTVKKQTNTEITITFDSANDELPTGNSFYKITCKYLGFDVAITDKNGCDGLKCPHKGHGKHVHIMNLSSSAPAVQAVCTLQLLVGNNNIVCATKEMKIAN